MVKLTKIYTRGGDAGKTSLGDGTRVSKTDARVAAYGDVDETNAALGLVRCHADRDVDAVLARIQNELFDLGADLCTPEAENPKYPPLRITDDQVRRLEADIDDFNADLEPLNSFVLPAGTPAAGFLHLARAVSRRAERSVVALAGMEAVNPAAVKYINRLSDLLFVLARTANARSGGDVLWKPGGTRGE
jgi:cob(I)alamin adenosyltransferase